MDPLFSLATRHTPACKESRTTLPERPMVRRARRKGRRFGVLFITDSIMSSEQYFALLNGEGGKSQRWSSSWSEVPGIALFFRTVVRRRLGLWCLDLEWRQGLFTFGANNPIRNSFLEHMPPQRRKSRREGGSFVVRPPAPRDAVLEDGAQVVVLRRRPGETLKGDARGAPPQRAKLGRALGVVRRAGPSASLDTRR